MATHDRPTRDPLVLLVDDASDDLEMYSMVLSSEGFRTQCTADIESALHIARTEHPDIVVADLHLPPLNGYVLLESLGVESRTRDIPFIVLTADATRVARARALAFRPAEFHVKPMSPQHLVAAIGRVLEGEALADAESRSVVQG